MTDVTPAIPAGEVGPVDAVLLSHDQHADNLDRAGREFLKHVPLVLTTTEGAPRLGGAARAMPPWYHLTLPRPDGGALRVTAVPAQHGPDGTTGITGDLTAAFARHGEAGRLAVLAPGASITR